MRAARRLLRAAAPAARLPLATVAALVPGATVPALAPSAAVGALVPIAALAALGPPAAAAQAPVRVATAAADSLFAAADTAAARQGYRAVLSTDAAASRALYQLARLARDGSSEQVAYLARYAALEPDDAWGHLALGDALLRAGRPRAALRAYARGLALEPENEEFLTAARRAELAARPELEPLFAAARDSDGNELIRAAGVVRVVGPADTRLGLHFERAQATARAAPGSAVTTLSASAEPALRPGVRAAASAGVARLSAPDGTRATRAVGSLRIRATGAGPNAAELRASRQLLDATPELMAGRLTLHEARVRATLGTGVLAVRGSARLGRIEGGDEAANRRAGFGVGLVAPVAPLIELSLNAKRLGYARSTSAGYFAPARVDGLELAVYAERYPGEWMLAFDAGAGGQRVARHGEPAGAWRPALRAWSSLERPLSESTRLGLELEAERSLLESPAAAERGWHHGAIRVVLRQRW